MRRSPVRTRISRRNEQMGGNFFDELTKTTGISLDPGQTIESWTKSTAQEYLPASIYEKAEQLAETKGQELLNKQYEALKQQATEKAMAEAQKMLSQKDVQDKGITSAVNAAAEQVSKNIIGIKDAYRTGGLKAVFAKYPFVKYAMFGLGGIAGILLLKFIIGKKRVKVVQAMANPCGRKKKYNPKRRKAGKKRRSRK